MAEKVVIGNAELWHGDCREVLPLLPRFDLLLTDPPYGFGQGIVNVGDCPAYADSYAWNDAPPDDDLIVLALQAAKQHIVCGGNYFPMLWAKPARGFIVWDKMQCSDKHADAELIWTSFDRNAKLYPQAEASLTAALKHQSDHAMARYHRGFVRVLTGRFDEALTIYGEALALDKDEPTVLSNRAWALLKLGRQDEALSDVERSLKSYPANPYALRTRALLYVAKGQREKACADLELARIIGGVDDVLQLITEHCAGIAPKR